MNSSLKCCLFFCKTFVIDHKSEVNHDNHSEALLNLSEEADIDYRINISYMECLGSLFKEINDYLKLRLIHEEMFDIYVDKVKYTVVDTKFESPTKKDPPKFVGTNKIIINNNFFISTS